MGKQGGIRIKVVLFLALAQAACAIAGCTSSTYQAGLTEPWLDMSGRYVSTAEIGNLGIVMLELERYEDTEVFSASMTGSAVPELEPGRGAGTIGDLHLILDFNIGFSSDYYFEGLVTQTNGVVESFSGQFLFPDEQDVLPVTFVAI